MSDRTPDRLRQPAGKSGLSDHSSTLLEALLGYTQGGAHAGHDEHRLGRLATGLQVDIIMGGDLESTPVEDLGRARAAITMSGGEITWEA